MRNGTLALACSLGCLLALSSKSYATIDPTTIPITRFLEVTQDIYRGARPTAAGLQALAKEGAKTDIDLENVTSAIKSETKVAKAAGLQFISKPLSASTAPDDQEVDEILALLQDPGNYPIFIHCELGEDRVGMISALYRVLVQKWSQADAYNEWLKDGFHPYLTALSDYFYQKTAGN